MTWHKVSDKAPPKDGRWIYRTTGHNGPAHRYRWGQHSSGRVGWLTTSGNEAQAEWSDNDYWTLAPGQEPAEAVAAESPDRYARAIEAVRLARAEIGQVILGLDAGPTDDGHWKLSDAGFARLGHVGWRLDRLLEGEVGRAIAGHPRAGTPEATPDEDSVEVRIAVAVDETRDWSARVDQGALDEDSSSDALDCLGGETASVSYVTARVPLPRPVEVRGEVEGVE